MSVCSKLDTSPIQSPRRLPASASSVELAGAAAPSRISSGRSADGDLRRPGESANDALHDVLELPHVARPVERHQRLLRVLRRASRARAAATSSFASDRGSAARGAAHPRAARAATACGRGSRSGDRTDLRGTVPSATIFLRSEFVAAMTRTSTSIVCESPTRSNSRDCSTRSSFACSAAAHRPHFVEEEACRDAPARYGPGDSRRRR